VTYTFTTLCADDGAAVRMSGLQLVTFSNCHACCDISTTSESSTLWDQQVLCMHQVLMLPDDLVCPVLLVFRPSLDPTHTTSAILPLPSHPGPNPPHPQVSHLMEEPLSSAPAPSKFGVVVWNRTLSPAACCTLSCCCTKHASSFMPLAGCLKIALLHSYLWSSAPQWHCGPWRTVLCTWKHHCPALRMCNMQGVVCRSLLHWSS
jgi:hypothetical protein